MNNRKVDIYNCTKGLKKVLEALEKKDLITKDKEILLEYYEDLRKKVSKGRQIKHIYTLLTVCDWFKGNFQEITKKEVDNIFLGLKDDLFTPKKHAWNCQTSEFYSPWTKHDFLACLKRFYRWLNKGEPHPFFKDINPRVFVKGYERYVDNDFMTDDEVETLRNNCEHPRNLALLDFLEQLGCRPSEATNCRIKDCSFDEYGAKIRLIGKTGPRTIRLVKVASLTRWLSCHPTRHILESPVFINIQSAKSKNQKSSPMSHASMANVFSLLFKKCKNNKPKNLYVWRHRRAQLFANSGWSEFELCSWFGWVIGSRSASSYIKNSGRRIEEKILEYHGVKKKEEVIIRSEKCPRCEATIAETNSKFCHRCSSPLSLQSAVLAEEYQKKKADVATEILEQGVDLSTTKGKLKAIQIIEKLKAQILL